MNQSLNMDAFEALASWFAVHARDLPWRRTSDPYAILVSELMLQQTQVVTVVRYYQRWLLRFPDVQALADASEEEVLRMWEGLGYYSRARNLHRAAKEIVALHGGIIPPDFDQIRALPGVGEYTAGAVGSFAHDLAVPAVDSNVIRVLARLFNIREPVDQARGKARIAELSTRLVQSAPDARIWNAAVMELGALLCRPKDPLCLMCPLKGECQAIEPASLPVKNPRRKTVSLSETGVLVMKEGRIAMQQSTQRKWRGLYHLPLCEVEEATLLEEGPVACLTYPFTHHQISLSIYRAESLPAETEVVWVDLSTLPTLPVAAPHRRVLKHLDLC